MQHNNRHNNAERDPSNPLVQRERELTEAVVLGQQTLRVVYGITDDELREVVPETRTTEGNQDDFTTAA